MSGRVRRARNSRTRPDGSKSNAARATVANHCGRKHAARFRVRMDRATALRGSRRSLGVHRTSEGPRHDEGARGGGRACRSDGRGVGNDATRRQVRVGSGQGQPLLGRPRPLRQSPLVPACLAIRLKSLTGGFTRVAEGPMGTLARLADRLSRFLEDQARRMKRAQRRRPPAAAGRGRLRRGSSGERIYRRVTNTAAVASINPSIAKASAESVGTGTDALGVAPGMAKPRTAMT